ncbi:MAG: response regulator [Burkholderiaceae bacterium]
MNLEHPLREMPMATLLVVDDQPVNVRAMNQAFAPDYRVLMAVGGVDALRICRERSPDLVLLDVVMPDLDGHEVCRQLKADPRTSGIPVIFVTAQDEPSQEMLGLQLGAVDFIVKPVNPAIVRARVRTHLELRRASMQLAQLNESLESRIVERTRELENALLAADAASRAKSQFLSNMSHEIRTPINGVIGMAYLALQADPAPIQRDFLNKIHVCGRHLLDIVSDILDFSKIEAGKLSLEDTEFLLSDICDGVASQTSQSARAKGLVLSFDIDCALEGVYRGDPLRIGQVLINYIGNAIKFSDAGEIRVSASCANVSEGMDIVRFEVSDQGFGLSSAKIAELFQPFKQADSSTTRRHGGSGLGLVICKELASLMGGEVGVRSVEGQGSTFWFTVALRRAEPALSEIARATAAPSGTDALRGARILVAEDNIINGELAIGLLKAVGAIAHVASDGRQAVDRSRCERYDCILMDVQMPVMDGLEATRHIRADKRMARTPILALTANAGEEDRQQCLDAGMDDFIAKPVNPADLYATLNRWLGPRAENAAPESSALAIPMPGVDVDLSMLARNVAGDPVLFRHFALRFLDSLQDTLVEVEDALVGQDIGRLADLGHRLKSSARTVGALGLADLCQALEDRRYDIDPTQAREVVEQMPAMFARVVVEITKEIE